jgi:hypothetical protein
MFLNTKFNQELFILRIIIKSAKEGHRHTDVHWKAISDYALLRKTPKIRGLSMVHTTSDGNTAQSIMLTLFSVTMILIF